MTFLQGKSLIELSKEYFKVVDFEDTAVADFATFAEIKIALSSFHRLTPPGSASGSFPP